MSRTGAVTAGLDSAATRSDLSVDTGLPARIDEVLAAYLHGRLAEATAIDPSFGAAATALEAFVLRGGKRIRPTFAWWGWRGAGGQPGQADEPAVLRAIGALELIHACALIHDDLMDDSTTRRGEPTVHVDFADRHVAAGWLGAAQRFGTAAAVLLGDLALVWGDDMLRAAGLPAAAVARAAPVWEAMRTEVLGGQYLDVLCQSTGESSPEAALRVNRYKTAAYTVERPLLLGAAMAGADAELIAGYRRFGADIGVAFQLRDDLLGVFGDPDVTGKPAGDDLREGKRTLLVALALRQAEQRGATAAGDLVSGALGDDTLDTRRLADVRAVLTELGAVAAVEQRITELRDGALAALATAPVAEPAAARLTELALVATRREH